MTDREIMQQALEALEWEWGGEPMGSLTWNSITALRERLAQPEQEPVAWMHNHIEGNVITHRPADLDRHPERWIALYTAPPQRTPLTDDLYNELLFAVETKCPDETRHQTALRYIKQAEMPSARPPQAAHGIKGEA